MEKDGGGPAQRRDKRLCPLWTRTATWTSSTSSGESLLGLLSDWVLAALALLLLSSSAT